MAGGFSGFTGYFKLTANYSATGPALYSNGPTLLQGVGQTPTFNQSYIYGTSVAFGCDLVYDSIITASASSTATLDVYTSITNILAATATFVRIKAILYKLLTAFDDSSNGTLCSSVTIGNAGSNPWQGFFGATTHTAILTGGSATAPGDWLAFSTVSAAGISTISSSHANILFTNNDASNAMAVRVILFGADA